MQHSEKGFIFLWALFAAALAGIVLAGTGQVWQITSQREKEKELLFVGDQFRQAVMSYYNDDAGPKQYPESLEQLLEDKRPLVTKRHLRKIFIDPMTNSTDWGLVAEPEPEQEGSSVSISTGKKKGFIGVYSLSKGMPMKVENFKDYHTDFSEAVTYQDWKFVFLDESAGAAANEKKPQSDTPPSSNSPFGSPSGSGSGSGSSSKSNPFSSNSSSPSSAPSQTNQNPFNQ